MDTIKKINQSIQNLKKAAEFNFSFNEDIFTKEDFDKIQWLQSDKTWSINNPHSEITWPLLNVEIIRLQAEYDALDYQRKRKAEYPSIEQLVVALYDTEDKLAIETKRKAIKEKYPK